MQDAVRRRLDAMARAEVAHRGRAGLPLRGVAEQRQVGQPRRRFNTAASRPQRRADYRLVERLARALSSNLSSRLGHPSGMTICSNDDV